MHFTNGEDSPPVSCIAKAIRSRAVNLVYLLDETKISVGFPSENFLIALYAGLFIVCILGQ